MKLRALVVDDEELARKDLVSILSRLDNFSIITEAENVPDARKKLESDDFDVVFLDVEMPRESGFSLLQSLDNSMKVIFVTAFDEYAVRAFEVNALDYLVKPVEEERLRNSVNRILLREPLNDEDDQASEEVDESPLNYDDVLFLHMGNEYQFVKIREIKYIIAANDYSEIFLRDGSNNLVRKSMLYWERRLPPDKFQRIHRSTIINLNDVEKLTPWFNNSRQVYLKGVEKPFTLSRRYFLKLKKLLG